MFKNISLIFALCASLLTAHAATADYQVVPLPQDISISKGKPFVLSASTPIVYTGNDAQMQRNAQFLSDYVDQLTKIRLNVSSQKVKKTTPIVLVLNPKISGNEAYVMTVTDKQLTIAGKTAAGVFYGIQTLRKSLPVLDAPEEIELPAAVIKDAPKFAYRGMMLDCGRHFFPVSFVKKYIDMLALHNMNVFHWHLTEDQGWRIEIKKYPKLTEIGSKRSGTIIGHNSAVDDSIPYGGYYTQEQAREIVKYAAERNITVIPEVDMPGHMLSALASYPELGCTGGPYEVGHKWGVYEDVLCLGNEKVYKFLEDIIDELIDIFPSKYIHIGGDESPRVRWEKCPKCQALAKAQGLTTDHLQAYFTNRIEKYINAKGRRIIGWDEILEGPINQSATIMSWRGVQPGTKAANLGHDVIMSPNSNAYFDYYQTKKTGGEPLNIGGYLPVSKVYEYDPTPESMPVEAQKHIVGVQANLWTEYVTCPTLAEYQVMPRMAAISEVQWLPSSKKNFDAFKTRVTKLAKIYDRLGYVYAKHLWTEK